MSMNLNAQWIVGLVDGKGCFNIRINQNESMQLGFQILPEFTVVQNEVDEQILHGLKDYFGCGVVRKNHGIKLSYRVQGQDNLRNRIIPFFEKHKLKTRNRVNFEKFRKVILLIEKGDHLKPEGFKKIQKIKTSMNSISFLR